MQATDEIARGGRRIRYQPLGLQSGPDEGVHRVITHGNRGPGESSERPVIRRWDRCRQGFSFGSRHRSHNDQNRNYSDNARPEAEYSPGRSRWNQVSRRLIGKAEIKTQSSNRRKRPPSLKTVKR